jgi:transcriptional antiterminator RfaH
MSAALESCWYVVRTQPRAEQRAAQQLRQQGFEVYLPRYQKRRRHARRVDMVAAPLFPRYLFVSLDLEHQRWRAVQSTIGVSHLVCNGDEPAPLSSAVVQEIRSREDARGFVSLAIPRFAQGEKVRVTDGAFSTCVGMFEEMADQNRVSILLDLLGRKVRVVLDLERLEVA